MNGRRFRFCKGREYRIRLTDLVLRLHGLTFNSSTNVSLQTTIVRIHQHSGASKKSMVNRKGVFIGAYVPNDLKETLRRRAAAEHRTLSQEITRILTEAVHGRTLPPGAIDRRNAIASQPRRRATDPPERRRRDDVPHNASDNSGGNTPD